MTTETETLYSALGEAERYAKDLEGKLTDMEETLSAIALKAGAGLCQLGANGKHEFLQDISNICNQAGFDVIGQKRPPAT